MMLGSGAGQQDRVNACRIAVAKASAGGAERVAGAVAASDAFFPFPDGPGLLLEAGVTAIIHPGGSVKDQETLDLVNQFGAAMVLTGSAALQALIELARVNRELGVYAAQGLRLNAGRARSFSVCVC